MTRRERATQIAGLVRDLANELAYAAWERIKPVLAIAAIVLVCFLITFADALGKWLIP